MKTMPLDPSIIDRRAAIVAAMRAIVGDERLITSDTAMRPYESDALTAYRQLPLLVVLPDTVQEVSKILTYAQDHGVKVVPRGAGTSLSGGALPLADGILMSMARFNTIHDIDYDNLCVTAGPGVTNLSITDAVTDEGFYYAPDPSSRIACTIGGNVAENSGGMHCLKYGLTTNNLLGLEMVLLTGEVITLGAADFTEGGLDLMGLVTGSEGMLGVVTKVVVRILPQPPEAITMLVGFASVEAAGETVAGIMGAGLIPGAMEMMDALAIQATEAFVTSGYPLDAAAVLIIELDGTAEEITSAEALVTRVAQKNGATSIKASSSESERLAMWQGRMSAFPAVGRLAPDYYCMDGTIPRAKLPEVLTAMGKMSERFGLQVANVFHAGDGNLHPLILYDANKPGEIETAEAFGDEILKLCVKVGGVLTGEHGVGIEKRDLMPEMFNETDLKVQQRIKCAFDPDGLLNPGKVFPVLHRCAELGRMHVHSADGARFPDLPRY